MSHKDLRFLLPMLLILTAASVSLAQNGEEGHSHDVNPYADPTMGPLILPDVEEFASPDGFGVDGTGAEKANGQIGASAFVEVTDKQKTGLLTPFYRFSPSFSLKARVPIILSRTMDFWAGEAKTSGLGDISMVAQYEREAGPGALWRFAGTVKLPTGDDEKMVDVDGVDFNVPLGTGTLDFVLKGQYAKSTTDMGWMASLMYRKNSGNESTWDNGSVVQTITNTNGDNAVGSVFARKRMSPKVWAHLGGTVTMTMDGTSKSEYSDSTPSSESDILQKGTLIDLYPGISYEAGPLQPFLGVRIPVSTSYDAMENAERNMAVLFQFSYNPNRI